MRGRWLFSNPVTYAPSANEPSASAASSVYEKPRTYKEFLTELMSACKKGDEDSKRVMEKLAPYLVKSLKKVKQWDCPSHCLYTPDDTLDLISCEKEFLEAVSDDSSEDVFDDLISLHLDKKARAAEPGISCEDNFHEISVFSLAKESAMDDTRQCASSVSQSTAVNSVQHHSSNSTSSVSQFTAVDSVQHNGTSSVSIVVDSVQHNGTSSVSQSTAVDSVQHNGTSSVSQSTAVDSVQHNGTSSVSQSTAVDSVQHNGIPPQFLSLQQLTLFSIIVPPQFLSLQQLTLFSIMVPPQFL